MLRIALLLSFFTCLGATELSAQAYTNAIGLRIGYPLSVSYKHSLSDGKALEVNAGTYGNRDRFSSWRWYSLGAGYQIHSDLDLGDLDGLRWYYGGGATIYLYSYQDRDIYYNDDDYTSYSFGVQGYIGLEYTFEDLPINVTIDWTPTLSFTGFNSGFGAGFAGLGVRYVLAR